MGHLTFHGLRDGPDVGDSFCLICFQEGKDVHLVTDHTNTCGPLCGYSLAGLRQHSIWSPSKAGQRAAALTAERPTLFFYSGRFNTERPVAKDAAGRLQVLEHARVPRFKVINTRTVDVASLRSFAVEFSESEFCYSPLGQNDGPSDRYVAAVLFGCIPVVLSSVLVSRFDNDIEFVGEKEVPLSQPLSEKLDWPSFAVLVEMHQLPQLPAILGNISLASRLAMRRRLLHVWKRFVYSSIFGDYLGETKGALPDVGGAVGAGDSRGDAFHSLMGVLARRVSQMPSLVPDRDER